MADNAAAIISLFGDPARAQPIQHAIDSLCRLFALSPADVFYKWEAFALSTNVSASAKGARLTLDNLAELRKDMQASADKNRHFASTTSSARPLRRPGTSKGPGDLLGMPTTPAAKPSRPSSATSAAMSGRSTLPSADRPLSPHSASNSPLPQSPTTPTTIAFANRPSPGQIYEILNPHLPQPLPIPTNINLSNTSSRVALASNADPKRYGYRYMHEKLGDRAEVLDATIDEFAELIKTYYEVQDLDDPSLISQEDVYCVGRIVQDPNSAAIADVKLTATSCFLESSRMVGAGMRVALKFDVNVLIRGDPPSDGVGLFPGCIVGLKGHNPSGKTFMVSEILPMPPPEPSITSIKEQEEYQYGENKLNGDALSVCIAAGPFTTTENLEYEPFVALCHALMQKKPDVVILIGPFVDQKHPLVASGKVFDSPHSLFQQNISERLAQVFIKSPQTTAILIPSPRDIISDHCCYPQSPLAREVELGLPKRAKLLPNPASFSINEIQFGITSVDTMFHLNHQELFIANKRHDALEATSATQSLDRLARIGQQVIRQRSFYPLFPAPVAPGLEDIQLDVSHGDLLKLGVQAGSPDIVILPSTLKSFVKIIDSTVVINPSFLAKKSIPGTYAITHIWPQARENVGTEARNAHEPGSIEIENKVWERCRVEIVAI